MDDRFAVLSLKEIKGLSESLPEVMHLQKEAPTRSSKYSALHGKESPNFNFKESPNFNF